MQVCRYERMSVLFASYPYCANMHIFIRNTMHVLREAANLFVQVFPGICTICSVPGWGLLKTQSLIFPLIVVILQLDHPNYIHICQVSPLLSFGDTCPIRMRYSVGNWCVDNLEKLGNSGTNEFSIVSPTPGGWKPLMIFYIMTGLDFS